MSNPIVLPDPKSLDWIVLYAWALASMAQSAKEVVHHE